MTATQLRAHADHFEELVRVRNHAAVLVDLLEAHDHGDDDLADAATQLALRIMRADALVA